MCVCGVCVRDEALFCGAGEVVRGRRPLGTRPLWQVIAHAGDDLFEHALVVLLPIAARDGLLRHHHHTIHEALHL